MGNSSKDIMRIRDLPEWFQTGGIIWHKKHGFLFVTYMSESIDRHDVAAHLAPVGHPEFKETFWIDKKTIENFEAAVVSGDGEYERRSDIHGLLGQPTSA